MNNEENMYPDSGHNETREPFLQKHKNAVIISSLLVIFMSFLSLFIILPQRVLINYRKTSNTSILRAATKSLNKEPDEFTNYDFSSVTRLDLSNETLTTLDILKKFENFKELFVKNIRFPKTEVSKWVNILKKPGIDFSQKYLSLDISALEKPGNLRKLDFSSTHFTPITIKDLKMIKNLRTLNLYGYKVISLEPFRELTNLQELDLGLTLKAKM